MFLTRLQHNRDRATSSYNERQLESQFLQNGRKTAVARVQTEEKLLRICRLKTTRSRRRRWMRLLYLVKTGVAGLLLTFGGKAEQRF